MGEALKWVVRIVCVAALILGFVFLSIGLVDLFAHNTTLAASGESATFSQDTVQDYGFGANKDLLVIDLSAIGGVDRLDLKDKQPATLRRYEGGKVTLEHTIGIEIKGRSSRSKLNYKFDFWKWDGDKDANYLLEDNWEDTEEDLFGTGYEYEEYFLRGGFLEPTLTRDEFAAVSPRIVTETGMPDARYDTKLYELIFCVDGQCTYEGVYLAMNEGGRDAIKNSQGWTVEGKKAKNGGCEDDDKVDEGMLIYEYTVQPHKTFECGPEYIIPQYPKCKHMKEECSSLYDRNAALYEAIGNETVGRVNIPAFADRFIFEQLMCGDDFPFASQFFMKYPKGLAVSYPLIGASKIAKAVDEGAVDEVVDLKKVALKDLTVEELEKAKTKKKAEKESLEEAIAVLEKEKSKKEAELGFFTKGEPDYDDKKAEIDLIKSTEEAIQTEMEKVTKELVAVTTALEAKEGPKDTEGNYLVLSTNAAGYAMNEQLFPAPPYDYDGIWWRSYTKGLEKTRGIEFVNRNYYGKPVAKLWEKLGRHAPFIEEVKTLGPRVEELNALFQGIIAKRKYELAQGYWDRNNARWGPYGNGNYKPATFRIDYLLYPDTSSPRDTMAEELDFAGKWFAKRAESVKEALPGLTEVPVKDESTTTATLEYATPMIVFFGVALLSGIVWAYNDDCCQCRRGYRIIA